jgi:DNA-binding response OmpR family regulator
MRSWPNMARVLVINDDPAILQLYQDALPELGHEAVTKPTAESGPDTVREVDADALVVDLQQPDEDHYGLRIIEQLRGDPELRRFPIVLATGAGPELEPIIERLTMLAVPVLQKPFGMDELGVTISFALAGSVAGD